MKKRLTSKQKEFIRANVKFDSINGMAKTMGVSYNLVRTYVHANNWNLSQEEIQKIRVKKITKHYKTNKPSPGYQPPKWVPDPWNHGLNLITMLTAPQAKPNEYEI